MKKGVFIAVVVVIGFFALWAQKPVFAQERPRAEVEVDTSVLKDLDNYQPPPMFGSPGGPELSRPLGKPYAPTLTPSAPDRETSVPKERYIAPPVTAQALLKAPPKKMVVPGRKPVSVISLRERPKGSVPARPEKESAANAAPAQKIPVPARRPESIAVTAKAAPARPNAKPGPAMPALPAGKVESVTLYEAPKKPAPAVSGPSTKPEEKATQKAEEQKKSSQKDADKTQASTEKKESLLTPGSVAFDDKNKDNKALTADHVDITAALTAPADQKPAPPEKAEKAVKKGDALPAPLPIAPAVTVHTPETPVQSRMISLKFKAGVADMAPENIFSLQQDVMKALGKDKESRLQIQAFASPADNGQSSARRISLSRALLVRTWLVDHGVDPARIDVRALGDQTQTRPLDRVDLLFTSIK